MSVYIYVRPIVEFEKTLFRNRFVKDNFLYPEIESKNEPLSFSSSGKFEITCVSETDFMLELGFFRIY